MCRDGMVLLYPAFRFITLHHSFLSQCLFQTAVNSLGAEVFCMESSWDSVWHKPENHQILDGKMNKERFLLERSSGTSLWPKRKRDESSWSQFAQAEGVETEGIPPGRNGWVEGHVLGSGCWGTETDVKDNHCGLESSMPVTLGDGKVSSWPMRLVGKMGLCERAGGDFGFALMRIHLQSLCILGNSVLWPPSVSWEGKILEQGLFPGKCVKET